MLKTLGLAAIAMVALSAVAASVAQAHQFVTSQHPAVLTGTNEEGTTHTFAIGGNAESCEDVHTVATLQQSPSEQLTVDPTYANGAGEDGKCLAFGSQDTVTVNHCAFVWTSNTEVTTEGQEHAHVNIECAEGNEITTEIPAAFVTLHIPAQTTTTHGLRYYNIEEEGHKAITVEATIKNITAKCTGFGCSILGGEHLIGETQVNEVITGYEDTGQALEGTERTTPENYEHNATPINIEVEGAPSR